MISEERARELRALIEKATASLNDEDALECITLFPEWQENVTYEIEERLSYSNKLYRCVQSHTSQENWTPDLTPALWTMVSVEEWPEWVQPTGAQDAYMAGDKVTHNELHWISTVDYNTWEPGIYGWSIA